MHTDISLQHRGDEALNSKENKNNKIDGNSNCDAGSVQSTDIRSFREYVGDIHELTDSDLCDDIIHLNSFQEDDCSYPYLDDGYVCSLRENDRDAYQDQSNNYSTHRDVSCENSIAISRQIQTPVNIAQISPRPHHTSSGIRFPEVDLQVLLQQRDILANNWPNISEAAWQVDPKFCEL